MKRFIFGIIGLALVALVILRVVQASADREPDPDVDEIRQRTGIPVEVARASIGPLVVRREFTGTLRGIRSATIRAKTGDEIIEIPVRVGQRVRAGDVLVRQSSLGSVAAVRQAEAAWEQAQRTVERLQPLKERGAISDQDWDNAVTALRVAEANLEAARRAVVLTTPFDGVVTDILENRGTVPSPGDPLVRVSDLSRIQVRLQVSPGQARELAIGQPAVLHSHGLEGQVTRIALQADPETRLLEVELTFPGAAAAQGVVPESLVRAQVEVGRRESCLVVPQSAVRESVIWVVDADELAHRREVRLGLRGNGNVEVLDGLADGERVVVAGASLLSEGARTRVVGGPGM
ncbi:MAG: efflux RND transporter periplasmic adaptor subunit [Gemmatimonadota bacterium]|nr:MAG: efflux RND transporter periplasmic adaptor subunit [Gemmatimonadota bacterium]